jgi:histidyl-tRNA synthetase
MIEPRVLKGTRDFGPKEKAKRDYVTGIIRRVFERYGYDSIETPVIEYAEVILGKYGEEGDKLTYNFKDNGDRHIALRYDQTVPFARFYAQNWGVLPSPFKRYEINRVWRADKPQKGRYREFYQCDIDIIGTDSLMCEIELALVARDVFKELGLTVVVRVNDRGLVDSVLDAAGIEVYARHTVISAIDKLDKVGREGVLKILGELITDEQVEFVMKLLDAKSIEDLSEFATIDLERFFELAASVGADTVLEFDPSLARGLDYYTGIIFETICPELNLGSIAGGGRYDNLCGSFSKQEFTGTGISFGLDRVMDTLDGLELLNNISLNSQVLVAVFDSEGEENSLKIYDELHKKGINAEVYFGEAKLAKQFKYADRKGIPYVVIAGPSEIEKGVVLLKDMKTGEQQETSISDLSFS